MANSPVKLGLVGLGGHMADNLLLRLMSLPADISAVCDTNLERLALVKGKYRIANSYTDYRNMLENEELDAVICSVDPQVHYEAAKACLLAGKHVFAEKTPCHTVEQAEELAELQRTTNCYAMVGFNRRFATAYMMAADIARRPEFGGVHMYQAKYHASEYGSKSSFIFNHIVNHLDLARYLVGELKITHVEHFVLDERRFGYNLTFIAESGTIGNIQSASVQHMTFPVERVELIGNGRNVIVDNLKNIAYNRPGQLNGGGEHAALADQRDTLIWNVNQGLHTSFTYLGYDLELQEFIRSAAERRTPVVHMEDTLKTIRLVHQFHSLIQ
ncbi:Gfo/Idh/MocA family protein [Paenibacillus piri]|uniref:Gfo/Idh/MocA family oxidoreductase n=1 Tax=Paenibacillus piri TaxID=2547395 RepID=A0A4R5KA80_9BACL|nr:Gfo/Idh/MocA family oxidoreductase [Paenibacillus piri]TDF91989.1 Gfo/Idh/MocA family oxidoreductase [Paenibacillus piri]